MRILVTTEAHFFSDSRRHVYVNGPAVYGVWANYLERFDEVRILARVGADAKVCAEEARADGPGVSFLALPDYRGPWEYLRHLRELRRRARQAIDECDAYILRVPGLVGGLVWRELRKRKKPYALEVVGDPWDAFGPGTWPSVFRPVFRRFGAAELRTMCREASAVHYVTRKSLQRRYPAATNAYTVGFSDALMDAAFAPAAKIDERIRRIAEFTSFTSGNGATFLGQGLSKQTLKPARVKPGVIGFVGSLSQMYKGPDVLLRAVAECRSRGLNVEAALAGEGRCEGAMKALARKLEIADRVRFLGQLPPGQPVFAFLDSIDLCVMPSRSEGLPRALLEAMARGCPCIGSNVGGIPELLDSAEMVPVGDARALAAKIMEVAASGSRMREMAARNLEKAKEFNPELLRELRREFYGAVRGEAEKVRQ